MKNNSQKFSIIIPIYNTECYLEECIESVINQTYKNIEIILVNDGSPGNAEEICKKFLKKDSRINYFYKKNEGVAIARNFGITKASGNYIFCIDSDDTIEPQFIEKINRHLNNKPELVILGKTFCRKNIPLIGALPTWGFAVKKDFLDRHPDIRFIENLQPCEDGLFSHKLLALTRKIVKCPDCEYLYRQHETSSEHSLKNSKILEEIPLWFEILEDFYNKYNLWSSHKLYLLAFIENEPFSLRLERMNFSSNEKEVLYNIIKNFINKHSLQTLFNIFYFDKKYRKFLLSNNYEEYSKFKVKS